MSIGFVFPAFVDAASVEGMGQVACSCATHDYATCDALRFRDQLHVIRVLFDAEHAASSEVSDVNEVIARRTAVLLARALFVIVQLDTLTVASLPPSVFVGSIDSVSALRARIYERIGRLNAEWSGEARRLRSNPSLMLARLASANFDIAFSFVTADPDVEHVLLEGLRADSPHVRRACRCLLAVASPASLRASNPRKDRS